MDTENKQTPQEKKDHPILDIIKPAAITAGAVLLFSIFAGHVTISGESMLPTFENGDKVLTRKVNYTPERGDIVVINTEKHPRTLIKRIIAISGDVIDIDFEAGEVRINGNLLDEPYIYEPTHERENEEIVYPLTVPDGYVFVMGDNRNHSIDSRQIGCVPAEDIDGEVFWQYMPINKFGKIQ